MPESPLFRSGLRRLLYPAIVHSLIRDEESNGQLDESRQRLSLRPEDCQALPTAQRTLAGRFVDVASGEVLVEQVDVEIPGVVPFRWARFWRSNQVMAGSVGNGWRHSYDFVLLEDRPSREVIIRLPDNRGVQFPALAEGETFLNRSEKLRLNRDQYGYQLQGTDGLLYRFALNPGGSLCRLASVGTVGTDYQLRFSYTNTGQLRRITDDFQRVVNVVTNAQQHISRLEIVQPNQPQKRLTLVDYQYDELHDLKDVMGGGQPTAQYHYRQHRLIRLTDSFRQSVYFSYEKLGNQHLCSELTIEKEQPSLQFRYLFAEGRTQVIDGAGGVRQYVHEGGIVQRVISAGGRQRVWFFSEYGELLSEQDALGNTSFFTYDEGGNMTEAAWPDGGTMQMQYTDNGQLISLTDRADGVWQWSYDEAGRLLSCINPVGAETHFTYAEDGLLTESTTANGQRSLWAYDAYGNRSVHTDQIGRQTSWEYDFLGQLIHVTQPDGTRTDVIRKANERSIVPINKGALTMAQDHLTYDADGLLIRLRRTNRLNWQFIRDAAGCVREYTRPDGTSTHFHYNAAGRLTEVLFSDGSWYHYTYRPDGWLVEATTPTTVIQFERDPLGRIVAETAGPVRVETVFDNAGRPMSWQSLNQTVVHNTYDDRGYLSHQEHADWQIQFAYDRLGRLVECQLPGGLQSRWQYDVGSLPVNHKLFWGSGLQASRSQTYSWEQQRLVRVEDNRYGTATIRYDDFNDPTEVVCSAGWTDRWVAERSHYQQRLLKPAPETAELGWQVLTVGTARFYYDADGYLREKRVSGQVWTFQWHESGVLQQVVRPDNRVIAFTYDALGRRLEKKVDDHSVRWAWNGRRLLHEWHHLPGSEPVQLTWHTAVGDEPTMLQVGTQWYSVVCTAAGQPLSFHNLQGEPVWEWRWCLFGKKHNLTGPSHWHTYLGGGQFEDQETGLIYANFRYFDAGTGLPISPEYSSPAGWARAERELPLAPESYLSAARYIRAY
ncbi:DUF6531 domain-containing protein [Spirosoma radiotolerans]|uniref:Sugar-binding protein n=1 Tax=Spirosoma radiotolerans TaxID=1379870 RepID=A0A0E3V876_9BACT|nr:DUF6531 domain-containing protein [Spirosoma radiotolerans]AKD56061.1 hypothetical protein SD10_15325 [Spirosoma radiotolerans]